MNGERRDWPPVYFAGAITGGRGDVESYGRIVGRLRECGVPVHGIHIASPELASTGETLDDETIYRRDVGWLEEVARGGGFILAEVSQPSLGVGYEIATAKHRLGMPVYCMFRQDSGRRCSAMITGDPRVTVIRYTSETLESAVDEILALVANKSSVNEVSGSRS